MKETLNQLIKNWRREIDTWLLVAIVVVLPFERIPSLDVAFITLRPSLLVGGLLILRSGYVAMQKKPAVRKRIGVAFIALYVLWLGLLIPTAVNQARAFQVTVFTGFTAAVGISVWYLWQQIHTSRRRVVVAGLIYTAVIVSLFGLLQYLGDFFGLPAYVTGLSARYSWRVFGFARVQSTGLEPLYFASYLLIPLMAGLGIGLFEKKLLRSTGLIILVFVTTLMLTLSRGAIYGFVAGLLVLSLMGWIYRKQIVPGMLKKLTVSVLLGLLIALGAVQIFNRPVQGPAEGKKAADAYVNQLKTTGTEGGGDDRARFRVAALKYLRDKPAVIIFGIGPGQFGPYIQDNQGDGGWAIVNNLPLEIWLETGLIGVLLLGFFLGWLAWQAVRYSQTARGLSLGLIIGLLGYFGTQVIQGQTYSTLYIMHVWVAIGLLWGIAAQPREKAQSHRKK